MKRALLVGIAAAALTGLSVPAVAGGSPGSAPYADVESVATVTSDVTVIFEFNLYDCPAGNPITVDWTAKEPSRPDSGAVGGGSYGLSNGANVQHLTLTAGASSFLAGERWTGSGTVNCGAIAIPVAGSGQAKSPNGV
jgi:hypothetical protein